MNSHIRSAIVWSCTGSAIYSVLLALSFEAVRMIWLATPMYQ